MPSAPLVTTSAAGATALDAGFAALKNLPTKGSALNPPNYFKNPLRSIPPLSNPTRAMPPLA